MAPAIIAALISAIPAVVQGISGASQRNKANRIESQYPLPEATIAPSINKMMNYSYGNTLNQDIPGGEMYRNEIKGATSAGLTAASELGSGAEAFGMLGQLVGREQNAFGDLAKQTAQQTKGYQSQYLDSLNAMAQEENRVWNWNKAQPYMQAAGMAAQLRNSGSQNMFAGLSSAAGIGAQYFANKDMMSSLLNGTSNKGVSGNISNDELMKILNGLKNPVQKVTTSNIDLPSFNQSSQTKLVSQ